jgi:hypothetical protein
MSSLRFASLGLAFVAFALVAHGCGSGDSSNNGFSPDNDAGDQDGTAPGSDGAVPSFDSSHGAMTALTITPATAQLTVTDLAAPPNQPLTATAKYADGTSSTIAASWTLDRPDIASIGAGTGLFTASAAVFGDVVVTAKAGSLSATAKINVALKLATNPGNVSGGQQGQLDGATTPDPSVKSFAYPYDKTVFPRGLLPPEQMWNGAAAGDFYSLEFVAPSYDLKVYLKADPPSRFTLPQATWNSLATTAKSADVTIKLRRLSGANAYVGPTQTWHVADANLRGSIYYWAINQGQIVKIDLPSGTRSLVFDSGPNNVIGTPTPINAGTLSSPPWQDNGGGKRCVACHSVSKDGSTLTSVFSRDGSNGPLGFVDLGSAAINAIGDYGKSGGTFDALTPDGKLAVVNYNSKTMALLNTQSGVPLASALDGQSNLCDPVFSPDGTKFALAANCDPGFGYPVEFRTSNLVLYDFAQATNAFTNARTVITSTGIGDAIAFPSFSPDSKWLFFQRGDYSRAKYTNGSNQNVHGNDDLFVASAGANATPVALDLANGKGYLTTDSSHLNYAPTVNPIAEGGYVWVVFTSPRDYGNEMASPQGAPPNDATYANRKQLWVTAVDANIGTVDPSHPAFWLPGQDSTSANMFGYWSLAKCKPTASDAGVSRCSAGFECCSGFCRDPGGDSGGPVCVDPPPGCHQLGEKCTTASDCCNAGAGIDCIGGFCQQTSAH